MRIIYYYCSEKNFNISCILEIFINVFVTLVVIRIASTNACLQECISEVTIRIYNIQF